jgi:alcohol dehydrogenase class IV
VIEFVYDQLPSRVVFGRGAARDRLAGELDRLDVHRVLLVATEWGAGLVDLPAGRVAGRFGAIREHVPIETARAVRAMAAEVDADAVLAVGGGSAIGAAKAVALTARIPVLAVPTTYSGSEMTPIWGLTENGRKTTGVDVAVLPRVVVYDPELTATLPRELAVFSALNGMAHGVEAFWAPGRNPVSSVIAEEGIAALAAGLRTEDPADLLRGAWLSAAAFAVAGSGLHHKLCHVLGGTFDLPHARTHAVVLPHVLAFNAPGSPEASARVARALGVDDPVRGLRELTAGLGVPSGLRELGLTEDQADEAARLTEPSVPADNPVPVGGGALRLLVHAAWEGKS